MNYLSRVSSLEAAQDYKKQSISLLGVQKGHHILEVGCGAGDEARAMAQMVGSGGKVIGPDYSNAMVDEAIRKGEGLSLPVEFTQGDVHSLEFDDNIFDGCRADRTFQHLENPAKAMSELVRVVRYGGRIVICEPDWDSFTLDSPNRDLTRKIIHAKSDKIRNGWMGRQLYSLFKSAGLEGVDVTANAFLSMDYATTNQILDFPAILEHAQEAYGISQSEGVDWLSHLQKIDEDGRFFS